MNMTCLRLFLAILILSVGPFSGSIAYADDEPMTTAELEANKKELECRRSLRDAVRSFIRRRIADPIRMTGVAVRDRFSIGVPHLELILENRVDDYRAQVWGSHNNGEEISRGRGIVFAEDGSLLDGYVQDDLGIVYREDVVEETGEKRMFIIPWARVPLKGSHSERAAILARIAAENGKTNVNAYYKVAEPSDRKTFKSLENIYERGESDPLDDEYHESIATVNQWVDNYEKYPDRLNRKMTEGVEALMNWEVLKDELTRIQPEDFAKPEISISGLVVEVYELVFDPATGETDIQKVNRPFYSYEELYSARNDAREHFEKIFGIPASPLEVVAREMRRLKRFDPSNLFSPLFYIYAPFNGIGSAFRMWKGFQYWLAAKTGLKGTVDLMIHAQAFTRRRLEMAYMTLVNRHNKLGYELTDDEKILLKRLEDALINSTAAPRSDAVSRVEGTELRVERRVAAGKASGEGGRLPLPNLDRYESSHDGIEQEISLRSSLRRRIATAFREHRAKIAGFILAGTVAGVVVSVIDGVKAVVFDNPRLNYSTAWVSEGFNHLIWEYMFLGAVPGDIQVQGKASERNWNLKNPGIVAVMDKHLSTYRHRRRMDPSYNFMQDPDFLKASEEVQMELLVMSEEYGRATMYGAQTNILENRVIPKRVVQLSKAFYVAEYPDHLESIDTILDQFIENGFPEGGIDLGPWQADLPDQLVKDLHFFFKEGFRKAEKHYDDDNFRSLDGFTGTPYLNFGRAPD